MAHAALKPDHKPIKQYYRDLEEYSAQRVSHEGAVETAFSRLLADTARSRGWTLIPKLPIKAGAKSIIPDGTLRDEHELRRGYWEAKDTHDDLDAEIRKKITKNYPRSNTIFEDTREAVLYQNGQEHGRFDLTDGQQLADLLNAFYEYTEPDIEGFEEAVDEFKERVPELARGLDAKIKKAHVDNSKFQKAFNEFFELCQQTLNPNIRKDAVDEMLVQHLLTERLFRTIFDDEEFTRRNVIASEVEKVIDALVGQSFSRKDFLKSLDKFYKAIEAAAATLEEFSEKQHFLNTVYERFFQGYSVKVADTHGIVYTPQEIVDFMCASVAEVLEKEFKLTLGSPGVNILDPCTGTGNFVVNLLRRIPKRDLPRVYKEQLFANEVMLLPYYIAALNIEHAYYEMTGKYEAFEGLCFVDTLDLAEEKPHLFTAFNEKNSERVERQKNAPITVILGNPPYNVGQLNENDNNKNRKYPELERRVRETYGKDSEATNKKALSDAFVKFFRWATDRLRDNDGILCFVSNNNFVSDVAFDGMRKHLVRDFDHIYHLDLHGNVRKNPKLSGTTHNVFGIQVGVGITLALRQNKKSAKNRSTHDVDYFRVSESLRASEKLAFLASKRTVSHVTWQEVVPDSRNHWFAGEEDEEFLQYLPMAGEKSIFQLLSPGAQTNRDSWMYDFDNVALQEKASRMIETYNSELARWIRKGMPTDIDSFVITDERQIKWSSRLKECFSRQTQSTFDLDAIRNSIYRPFTRRCLYFDRIMTHRRGLFAKIFPSKRSEKENVTVVVVGPGADHQTFLIANSIVDVKCGISGNAATECFPFYVYDEDGSNRRENITDWALAQFRERYGDAQTTTKERRGLSPPGNQHGGDKPRRSLKASKSASRTTGERTIGKWDIFYYVYGILHHPGYRTKFADNLKRELPRIPFAPDFWAFADAGRELAKLHLEYEKLKPYSLKFVETEDEPLSYRVEKMRLSKDKTELKVNDSLTLAGIPPEVFEYRLGNRSALDWVIDQYQVSEDKRSGIKSDPNRADDEEYIVRLVGQVVRVSVETVKIVRALPTEYAEK